MRSPCFIILFGIIYINISNAVNGYNNENDWGKQALSIQSTIDNGLPLYETIWIGTHNSFSNNDDDSFGSYALNQPKSILNQLKRGIRYLVLDVHFSNIDNNGNKEIRCCHYSNPDEWYQKAGLSLAGIHECGYYTGTRRLGPIFDDIIEFIEDNRNQVLFIKFELANSMKDKLNRLNNLIEDRFGNDGKRYIYRPKLDHGGSLPKNRCFGLDITMTKSMILNANKNIIFYTKDGCRKEIKKYFFQDTGSNSIKNYGQSIPNSIDITKFSRIFDGSVKGEKKIVIHRNNIESLFDGGLNIFELYGFDGDSSWNGKNKMVIQNHKAVWSWNKWYPSKNNGDCVCFNVGASKKFQNAVSCNNLKKAACYNDRNNNWKVTHIANAWPDAGLQCMNEYGSNYKFDVPKTPIQRNDLANLNKQDIWVNYKKSNNEWIVNYQTNYLPIYHHELPNNGNIIIGLILIAIFVNNIILGVFCVRKMNKKTKYKIINQSDQSSTEFD